ncbi:MAG: HAMP domain-containing histidine kinase [Clostridiales bacterium]|nr:HAMP domain-containing histidine kinase [Clostridiales bacterium]
MLYIVVGLLIFIIIILVLYIAIIQKQFISINSQLNKKLKEKTKEYISIQLINKELNNVVSNINRALKEEENAKLISIREEKKFKELIANISHDLRTPLTAIKGYQQLMEKENMSKEQREKLLIAEKHAEDLGNLIEHFFEYSYLISADPEVNIGKLNLSNIVTECIADVVPLFEDRNIKVDIKELQSPIFVLGDKEMVVRVINNLLRNSAFHSSGNVEVELFKDDKVYLIFRNPVSNPSEINVSRIFDRFYTGDKSRGKSTGLGLAIVKLLTEKMEGKVYGELKGNVIEIKLELPTY